MIVCLKRESLLYPYEMLYDCIYIISILNIFISTCISIVLREFLRPNSKSAEYTLKSHFFPGYALFPYIFNFNVYSNIR